jgi:AcrR family transcriptional regulator
MAYTVRLEKRFVKPYTLSMPFPSKTTPETIVQTAIELLEIHGLEALSTRTLAQACGIKAPSLYRYFPDRSSLLHAIAAVAAQNLDAQLLGIQLEPKPALHQAATIYLGFAQQHPALYELLMQPQPSTGAPKKLWNTFLALVGKITGNPDDTANAVAFWAFLHGYATLERNGTFGASGAQGALFVGLETWLAGLETKKDARVFSSIK